MAAKRKDKNRIVLKKGEGYREKEDRYYFRWTEEDGTRHTVYAKTLDELREKEDDILKDLSTGIKPSAKRVVTLNEMFETWKEVKRGLKDTSFQLYCHQYNLYVRDTLGKRNIGSIKKSDIKKFYNSLQENRGLQVATINTVHVVLSQLFSMAVDDYLIQANPVNGTLCDLKKTLSFREPKHTALTAEQEKAFLDYLRAHKVYRRWYPLCAVMVGSGLRIAEVLGLRWQDIDLEKGIIDVNHTLMYYNPHHAADQKEGKSYQFFIGTTKTPSSIRKVPMLSSVKEAFETERNYQREHGIRCKSTVDSYTDFIFVNRNGHVMTCAAINTVLRNIVRGYNEQQLNHGEDGVLLPHISCHSFRHTFATRLCEEGVNIKVIQNVMGHSDIGITMNVYTEVTESLKQRELENLEQLISDRVSMTPN